MRQPLPPVPMTLERRVRIAARDLLGGLVRAAWSVATEFGAISPTSRAARRFGAFGDGSAVCFPIGPVMNPGSISIGSHVLIAPDVTLSAGWGPDHPGLPPDVVTIGDRCLIGRGSSIVAHAGITVGDDVWTGHDVYITDMNHGYDDVARPISVQHQPAAPVSIGDGSWLGHGVVVLPGVTIGRHVAVGAGSVVTTDLPDNCVAVGSPARVVRIHDGVEWVRAVREQEAGAEVARLAHSPT